DCSAWLYRTCACAVGSSGSQPGDGGPAAGATDISQSTDLRSCCRSRRGVCERDSSRVGRDADARGRRAAEGVNMAAKLLFGIIITLLAILALVLVVVVIGGILAGLLAPVLGSVPISYNFRSIRARWTSTIVAILGIAGTVGVFVAMLSLARGFRATLVASGSAGNALVMRAGSTSEMMGGITLDSVKIAMDQPGVARDASGQPLATQEVVGVIPIPLIST